MEIRSWIKPGKVFLVLIQFIISSHFLLIWIPPNGNLAGNLKSLLSSLSGIPLFPDYGWMSNKLWTKKLKNCFNFSEDHMYLIYLYRAGFTWMQIKVSPFKMWIPNGYMLLYTNLWLISLFLNWLTYMHLLKVDNKIWHHLSRYSFSKIEINLSIYSVYSNIVT